MSSLRISASLHRTLSAHAEQTYPHECCGILLGSQDSDCWHIETALPAANSSTGCTHNRYTIAPPQLVRALREARRRGLDIAGFYHSHPGQSAHWSRTDLDQAHWLGCIYLIVAVDQGRATGINSFLLCSSSPEDKRFEPQFMEVDEVPAPLSSIRVVNP